MESMLRASFRPKGVWVESVVEARYFAGAADAASGRREQYVLGEGAPQWAHLLPR